MSVRRVKTRFLNLQTVIHFIYFFPNAWIAVAVKPPTMVGEPLNPHDFEMGSSFVMDPELENDMTINDGTMNDILEEEADQTLRSTSVNRWPDAEMPYLLDSSFDDGERAMIAKAIELIQDFTCFRIISRTFQDEYVLVRKNINSTSCNSYVGMIGGKQRLNLAPRCIERVGSTAHEFMHAMGFHHEQSRPDRDNYVTVNYENIINGRESNFEIHDGEYGNTDGSYDKLSIMHYSRTAFSRNGEDTMVPVKGGGELGQRKGLTKKDMKKVNEYYECDADRTHPMASDDSSEEFDTGTRAQSTCEDFNSSECELWAYHGYCERSEMFMTVFCKKTCNKCSMGCKDMNQQCTDWMKKKYCEKYSDYMEYYCAKSCKRC